MNRLKWIYTLAVLTIGISLGLTNNASAEVLGANLIVNGNLETAISNKPSNWTSNSWGNIKATFTYEGKTNHFVKTNVTSGTVGDAKWAPNAVTVTPNTKYKISERYRSTVATQLDLAITDTSNKVSYIWLADLPASSTWKDFSVYYTTPANIKSIQILHGIPTKGQLSLDNIVLQSVTTDVITVPNNYNYISLTFDDAWRSVYTNALPLLNKYNFKSTQYLLTEVTTWSGYMDELMMRAFYTQNHEIGSHTVSHPDLTTLPVPQITTELVNSKNWLQTRFGPVTSFASPYGAYNNTTINEIAKYYTSHRTVDEGYNTKVGFNPLKLKVQNIVQTTTTQEITAWIQESKKQNAWLILVYHQIDNSGAFYGTTPAKLDAQLNIIKNSALPVVTVRDGVTLLSK